MGGTVTESQIDTSVPHRLSADQGWCPQLRLGALSRHDTNCALNWAHVIAVNGRPGAATINVPRWFVGNARTPLCRSISGVSLVDSMVMRCVMFMTNTSAQRSDTLSRKFRKGH